MGDEAEIINIKEDVNDNNGVVVWEGEIGAPGLVAGNGRDR